jgi:hypothetical protein
MVHNGTPQTYPNMPTCPLIPMYLQGPVPLANFIDKSKGNIQVRHIVLFVLKCSSCSLPICYFKT